MLEMKNKVGSSKAILSWKVKLSLSLNWGFFEAGLVSSVFVDKFQRVKAENTRNEKKTGYPKPKGAMRLL